MPAPSARRQAVDVVVALVVGWAMWVSGHWPTMAGGPGWWTGDHDRTGPPQWQRGPLDLSSLPFVLVVIIALSLRRVWPRAAFVAVTLAGTGYVAVGGAFPPALLAILLCVHVLASTLPLRRWLPLTALMVIFVLGSGWGRPYLGLLSPQTYGNLVFAVALGAAVALFAIVRVGRHDASRQRRADELERAASDERLRVAREVHDVVGHSLSVISMQAGVALHVLDRRPDQIRASLEAIRTTSSEAMAELRLALGVFRSTEGSPTAPAPNLDRVDALVTALRAAGRDVTVHRDVPPEVELSTTVQQTAFRIVQESLTNVVRHAEHAGAVVRISATPDRLELDVSDDGPLLTGPVVEGNGLRGMRERVTAIGGRLVVQPRPTGGLRVHATLPVEAGSSSGTSLASSQQGDTA
jgi:signal transduction histidine kinase